jgi:hypothetical protein
LKIWIIIDLKKEDLHKLDEIELVTNAGLNGFTVVEPTVIGNEKKSYAKTIVRLQQETPQEYTSDPIEALQCLSNAIGK